MLKGIPKILPPELLKIMMEMGHSDEIVLADGNFPSAALGKRVVRCDGHGVPEVLDAMLKFFPLDTYVESPVTLMQIVPGDSVVPTIWDTYQEIIERHQPVKIDLMERFAFYERAQTAYAVVATGENALYANIILKKGVVND